MAKYTSKTISVPKGQSEIAEKFNDLTQLQAVVDKLPEEQRQKIGEVEFTADSITLKTQQVGAVGFEVTERQEDKVKMTAKGAPIKMDICINFTAVAEAQTDVNVEMDVDIPMMLRPMVGGMMQKAVDQFAQMIEGVMR